jgi:hypothetical protein
VSIVRELQADELPGKDLNKVSRAIFVSSSLAYALSEDGICTVTVNVDKLIFADAKVEGIPQAKITSLWSDATTSGYVRIEPEDEGEIRITSFPSTDFTGTSKTYTWEFDAKIKPLSNTQALKWTDAVQVPPVDYWFAYAPENEFTAKKNEGFAWFEIDAAPAANSGSIDLQISTNFPVDITSLLYMTIEGDSIWTAYKSLAGTGIAKCKLTESNSKLIILAKVNCQEYTIPTSQKKADAAVIIKDDTSYFVWFYTNDTGVKSISYCDLDTTTFAAENCVESNQYLETFGGQFD